MYVGVILFGDNRGRIFNAKCIMMLLYESRLFFNFCLKKVNNLKKKCELITTVLIEKLNFESKLSLKFLFNLEIGHLHHNIVY